MIIKAPNISPETIPLPLAPQLWGHVIRCSTYCSPASTYTLSISKIVKFKLGCLFRSHISTQEDILISRWMIFSRVGILAYLISSSRYQSNLYLLILSSRSDRPSCQDSRSVIIPGLIPPSRDRPTCRDFQSVSVIEFSNTNSPFFGGFSPSKSHITHFYPFYHLDIPLPLPLKNHNSLTGGPIQEFLLDFRSIYAPYTHSLWISKIRQGENATPRSRAFRPVA